MSPEALSRTQHIQALSEELERLSARGELTKEVFQRAWREEQEALGPDHQDGLETLVLFAQDESWIPGGIEGEGDDEPPLSEPDHPAA